MLSPASIKDLSRMAGGGFFPEPVLTRAHFSFFHGLSAIQNPRLFETSVAIKRFSVGRFADVCRFNPADDILAAFHMPNVIGLSRDANVRGQQEELIDKIATAALSHAGIMMLLGVMREQLGDHYYHCLRTGVILCSLQDRFDPANALSTRTLALIGTLHDVGKLEVPGELLSHPGKLTLEQTEAMKRHNEAGRRILTPFHEDFPHLGNIVVFHHPDQRTGFDRRSTARRLEPGKIVSEQRSNEDRRSGDRRSSNPDIRRAGMLLRMADSYDALASWRTYRNALIPADEVNGIMRAAFSTYGEVVDYLFGEFPCPKG